MEFMQASSKCYKSISKLNIDFVSLDDVKTALECVGTNNWGLLYENYPSEVELANGQNTERNQ